RWQVRVSCPPASALDVSSGGGSVGCWAAWVAGPHGARRGGDDDLSGGPQGQGPAVAVDQVMVVGAQQAEVVEVGVSAVAPVDDVVSVGEPHRPITPREPAATVTQRDGPEQ